MKEFGIAGGSPGEILPEPGNMLKAFKTLIDLFCSKYSKKEYLDFMARFIQNWSGCRHVGIRILDEKGFIAYESYIGFSKEFCEDENYLSINSDTCACIRVITGCSNQQDIPAMTEKGSFYCNNLAQYCNGLSNEAKARLRGRCLREGYVSVAVIPVKNQGRIMGAIHIADKEEGKLPEHVVEFVESIAALIGEAIARYKMEVEILRREQLEKQLQYLSYHDPLTGLYNRTYFEERMSYLEDHRVFPVGLILCDLDGLKLVNDTLGHDTGDILLIALAGILEKYFGSEVVIARVGGDEFAVLLQNCDGFVVESACSKLREAVERYNTSKSRLLLSASIGFSVREDTGKSMRELFKEADNAMYREKLQHIQSTRSSVVRTLTKALEVRDFITEGHAERLQNMVAGLGRKLRLPKRRIDDLRLLARFHDIGKVGISESILFKKGPLDLKERDEMRRHCEIGFRIARSSPELIPIADWILKHHEWWNGEGYPLNLKGEDIPLECRIFSIADAFDAMTNDRPYRSAMSCEAALSDLRKCSGTQFDPQLTEKFLEMWDDYDFH